MTRTQKRIRTPTQTQVSDRTKVMQMSAVKRTNGRGDNSKNTNSQVDNTHGRGM